MLEASLEQTIVAVCVGFLISTPRTGPNVSAYRPVYLFLTVIDVWKVIPLDRVKVKTNVSVNSNWVHPPG